MRPYNMKPEILPGTLDLMVLKTLPTLGPFNGYGLARRVEQIAVNLIELNQHRDAPTHRRGPSPRLRLFSRA